MTNESVEKNSWLSLPPPTSTAEAIALQQTWRSKVVTHDDFAPIRYVAGVDVAFPADGISQAAVVVLDVTDLSVSASAVVRQATTFPYRPGLLAFREVPPILAALQQLKQPPDLIICDGHGYVHPRRFGLACHVGVVTNVPAIGVAKTHLMGQYDPPALARGSWQPLRDSGEVIGAVLRTRANVRPVYVSVGHRISLSSAIDYVLRCSPRYRLPETTRQADYLASHGRLLGT